MSKARTLASRFPLAAFFTVAATLATVGTLLLASGLVGPGRLGPVLNVGALSVVLWLFAAGAWVRPLAERFL